MIEEIMPPRGIGSSNQAHCGGGGGSCCGSSAAVVAPAVIVLLLLLCMLFCDHKPHMTMVFDVGVLVQLGYNHNPSWAKTPASQ